MITTQKVIGVANINVKIGKVIPMFNRINIADGLKVMFDGFTIFTVGIINPAQIIQCITDVIIIICLL